MNTNKQYKRVPFDIELAKKIQSGEVEGRILNNLKNEVRILCLDRDDAVVPIIALFKVDGGEGVMYVKKDGHATNCRDFLVLEMPDNEPQFKPFDKVLVRNDEDEVWQPRLYEIYYGRTEKHYCQDGQGYTQCIPFEGNEHLVGTTNSPL